MKRILSLIKNELVTGLLLIAPVGAAAWLVWWLITSVDDLFPEWLRQRLGVSVRGLGLLAVLAVALIVGLLAHNFVGRRLVAVFDNLVQRIPVFGATYGLLKQVLEAVFA